MNLSKKLLILCFCVSNLSFSNSNPPLEAVACWSCITSDISGGYLGVQVGAVGGPLGSMALGVIGAVGWSLSSYHDQHGLVVNNGNPTIITESNKYDIVGELHNQILAKLIAKKIKPNDYDSIIQVSLIEIKKNSRFIELKDDVNFIANSRNVLNQYSKDAKVLDVELANFVLDIKSDFEKGINLSLITKKIEDKEKKSKDNITTLVSLSILKHSYEFWKK